uniref:WD_REPEATS_REGION domain-containing protein n=1 Tax=Rhabditophanes sp. KR3021 TaxID=114890 RepID=A0AC35U412_9BILA
MAKLERVLGSTSCPNSISIDQVSGTIAYPAGSTVILFNPRTGAEAHLIGTSKNNISALNFSHNGRFIATGECGHEPKIRVWEVLNSEGKFVGKQLCELKHHSLGIGTLLFTLDDEQLISVGNQHDKAIAVWNWKKECIVAKNNLTSHIFSMAISGSGDHFVTVGVRHIKFWNLSKSDQLKSAVLQGRSAILSDKRNNTFTNVITTKNNRCFALTSTKQLIEFQDKKLVNTYEMGDLVPGSLATGQNLLFIGCSDGVVEVYDIESLEKVTRLPKPHWLGYDPQTINTEDALNSNEHPPNSRYPNVHSMVFCMKSSSLTVFYSDRSFYTWSIGSDFRIKKIHSSIFHVGAVFGLETFPLLDSPHLSPDVFFTCGADDTIRVWNIHKNKQTFDKRTDNLYSKDLKKTLYFCESYDILNEQPRKNFTTVASDVLDSQTGVRCLKVSPEGKELAAGFRNGNLVVLDLTTSTFNKIIECEAHDDEIRCMEYSKPNDLSLPYLFATASRDRNVHIFSPLDKYSHLYAIRENSSTVTSILFTPFNDDLFLYTSAADKLVIISKIRTEGKELHVDRFNQINCTSGINNLILSPDGQDLVSACQDRNIRTFSKNGKEVKVIKGSLSNQGQATKICLDASGTFAAIICTDRYTYIIEMATSNCVAVLDSDTVSSVSFSSDCKRIILVSYSGCIYVWRLSNLLTKKMNLKLKRSDSAETNTIDITDSPSKPGTLFDGGSDRSVSPDSVIESASDSASNSGHKKSPTYSGSNFGSITSVQIAGDEDDLDSGVGVHQSSSVIIKNPKNINSQNQCDRKSYLHKVVPDVGERKFSSSISSSVNQSPVTTPSEEGLPLNDQMLNPPSIHTPPNTNHYAMPSYAASRSMSNIHHSGDKPIRPRRRWDVDPNPTIVSTPSPQYQQQTSHAVQQPSPHQISPQMTMSMFNSKSTGSLRQQMMDELGSVNSPLNSSTPRASTHNLRAQLLESNKAKQGTSIKSSGSESNTPSYSQFRRGTAGVRNSISKRVNTASSDIFSNSSPGSDRKASATVESPAKSRRQSSIFQGSTSNLRGPISLSEKRPPTQDYTTSSLYLRSRSQSPQTLVLGHQQQRNGNRRDSSVTIGQKSMYSSKSNLRTMSSATMGQSSNAMSKLNELRNNLRKSQENLALRTALEGQDAAEATQKFPSSMARSRSIGNLKLNTITNSINIGANSRNASPDLNSLRASRCLARSATNLQNEEDANLMYGGNRGNTTAKGPSSRFSSSIRNLQKSSKPDLTDASLYDNSETNSLDKESNDENLNGSTFSFSNSKKLRKGAVQKRVERIQPKNRLYSKFDQNLITSGDSDSNQSDIPNFHQPSPYTSHNQYHSADHEQTSPSSNAPSSIEATNRTFNGNAGAQFRRFAPNGIRKGSNYFAKNLESNSPSSSVVSTNVNNFNSNELSSNNPQAQNMIKHVDECIKEFQTHLDKLLYAKNMLSNDSVLPKDCTDHLIRAIDQASTNAKYRL